MAGRNRRVKEIAILDVGWATPLAMYPLRMDNHRQPTSQAMKEFLILTAVLAFSTSVVADPPARLKTEMPGVWLEVYTERKPFEERLGKVNVVDFDDVDTAAADVVPFEADRYKAKLGVVITGKDGQYAGRTFGYPNDYVPTSKPNSYAPGPKSDQGKGEGGFETAVTFFVGDRESAVAGFGAVFIDADYPNYGLCRLGVHGPDGQELAEVKGFSGKSASQLFRGVVAVNEAGRPVAVIRKVAIVNGTGWPSSSRAEGVTLDDFVFGQPTAVGALVAQNGPATTKAPTPKPAAPEQPSTTSSPMPQPMPRERQGGVAAATDLVDLIVSGFKPGEMSADTRAAIAAMLKADVTTGRTALARANDAHAEPLRLAAGLLDKPNIDPFSLIAYTFNYQASSAAFLPNGQPDPVSVVLLALGRRVENDAELRPYVADAVKALCVVNLVQNLRAGRPVGLSDHILFSGLRTRPRKQRDKRSSGDQKRYGPLPDPDPLPTKARGAVDHEELCSDPEERKRYLGNENAPRYWFLARNVRNDGYYLCTGLWYNAMTFADKCDPDSRGRWDKVFTAIAQAYADERRYTSALIVKMLSGANAVPFLVECTQRVDPKDAVRVTNLTIAFGYFLESSLGKWPAGLKGTSLGELHTKLAEVAKPAELDMARRCGGLDRKSFDKTP